VRAEVPCEAASDRAAAEGNVGAGAGAIVGKLFGIDRAMKGGIGSAAISVNGITVAAIVAVNAVGDIVDPASGRIVAGARSADGRTLLGATQAILRGESPASFLPASATTLGVVATDALLTKAEANKLAQMSHDGLARSINPAHTRDDGDTIFALATGASQRSGNMTVLGTMAAEVVSLAVLRAVNAAESIGGNGVPSIPAARDFVHP